MVVTALTKASGKNLLYFGCRSKAKDFLYKDELSKFQPYSKGVCIEELQVVDNNNHVLIISDEWVKDGILEMRTAFSRDQAKKIYVQNLIVEDARSIWTLLQVICGILKYYYIIGKIFAVLDFF